MENYWHIKNIHVGTANEVHIARSKQPGREAFQKAVGILHIHPEPKIPIDPKQYQNLSAADFRGLLTDDEMIFVHARYGQEDLIALKTTATPNVSEERVDEVLKNIEDEFFKFPYKGSFTLDAIKFTKLVCLETGLVLYRTSPGSTIAKREPVAK